jgi:hypothetical protein
MSYYSMQRIVKMNKTEDEEITEEQLSDEEIVNLSEGKT